MSGVWERSDADDGWVMRNTNEAFEYQMRKTLPKPCANLLESASEVYGILGPANISHIGKKHSHAFERLRSALIAMRDEGYVAEGWPYRGDAE